MIRVVSDHHQYDGGKFFVAHHAQTHPGGREYQADLAARYHSPPHQPLVDVSRSQTGDDLGKHRRRNVIPNATNNT